MTFVWMRKGEGGGFNAVRQVNLDENMLEQIADILKIPKTRRGRGIMYIATKRPSPAARTAAPRSPPGRRR